MTEFEINKAVAEKLGLIFKCSKSLGYITVLGTIFDPCNNVEQAWEIMMEYNISVMRDGDGYDAVLNIEYMGNNEYSSGDNDFYYHEKPLVSAMLCFLEINK